MIRAIDELRRWFAKRDISTNGLTVILNFSDARAAIAFDGAITGELAALEVTDKPFELCLQNGMTIYGIKVKLESPVHEPL